MDELYVIGVNKILEKTGSIKKLQMFKSVNSLQELFKDPDFQALSTADQYMALLAVTARLFRDYNKFPENKPADRNFNDLFYQAQNISINGSIFPLITHPFFPKFPVKTILSFSSLHRKD